MNTKFFAIRNSKQNFLTKDWAVIARNREIIGLIVRFPKRHNGNDWNCYKVVLTSYALTLEAKKEPRSWREKCIINGQEYPLTGLEIGQRDGKDIFLTFSKICVSDVGNEYQTCIDEEISVSWFGGDFSSLFVFANNHGMLNSISYYQWGTESEETPYKKILKKIVAEKVQLEYENLSIEDILQHAETTWNVEEIKKSIEWEIFTKAREAALIEYENKYTSDREHVYVAGKPVWLDMKNFRDIDNAYVRVVTECDNISYNTHKDEHFFLTSKIHSVLETHKKRLLTELEGKYILSLPRRWDNKLYGFWITFEKVKNGTVEIFFPASGSVYVPNIPSGLAKEVRFLIDSPTNNVLSLSENFGECHEEGHIKMMCPARCINVEDENLPDE